MPAKHCTTMYGITRLEDRLPPKNIIRDTAGLKCPPLIAPPNKIAAASAMPIGIASPCDRMTERNIKVPTNSTNSCDHILYYYNVKKTLIISLFLVECSH